MSEAPFPREEVEPFRRIFLESDTKFARIGAGALGGKATGLLSARRVLESHRGEIADGRMKVEVPSTVIISSEVFEAFITRNDLVSMAASREPDGRIAHAFQKGDFPSEHVGDLMGLIQATRGTPLAVRSSSLTEDSLAHPLAGVFETKMIPNNLNDSGARFRQLVEAIRFVYASTYFGAARHYFNAIGRDIESERMSVLVQEVIGRKHGHRFYPELSGVCRSYNYYHGATTKPEDGVVSLALGLGKTVVDGGACWSYSPSRPKAGPPFSSVQDQLKYTQLYFWAVNVEPSTGYNPTKETEYLVRGDLRDAEYDGTLGHVASTYDGALDRIVPGMASRGPRILDFAPLLRLERWPLNHVLTQVMDLFEDEVGGPVEVEFALSIPPEISHPAVLTILQVRAMMVSDRAINIPESTRGDPGLVVYSEHVLGNGATATLDDVVFVKPEIFDMRHSAQMATELESLNRRLTEQKRNYILIGFGRWGSSEPWLGIPVKWGQISGARVIVEATLPELDVEPSQGSHFFHNIESFGVSYFFVHHRVDPPIDWDWLNRQETEFESDLVRHVRTKHPLLVEVDGRSGHGAIRHDDSIEERRARNSSTAKT